MTTMPVENGFYPTSGFGPRWGQFHWGTDFGCGGGSGGKPIFATRDGIITAAGPAQGFGQWIWLDHDASLGGGVSVYGHIIPEVHTGQHVYEGQRIGHINPNSATNGGVAPHLHYEDHAYTWVPHTQRKAGHNIYDPMARLKDAAWPGQPRKEETMPLFGIDVSEHQNGMSLKRAAAEGINFAILRLCDGTHRDSCFQSHLEDVAGTPMHYSAYWYVRSPKWGTSFAQQVDVIDAQMGGRRDIGVWLDIEDVARDGKTKLLTKDDVWAAKRELESRGYYVPGVYTGAWYWEHMPGGEPSMDGLGYLWCSNYGPTNESGSPQSLYLTDGGDNHPGWAYPLGDRKPDILQIGSRGQIAGFEVDTNVFRGSMQEIGEIFTGNRHAATPAPTPPEPVGNIGEIQDTLRDIQQKITELAGERESFINPDVKFRGRPLLGVIDATGFAILALLKAMAQAMKLDPDKIINDAVQADKERTR